jgi:hypothetical protein
MRFAWWPHTTNKAVASYRLRCDQIIKELKKRGEDAGIYDYSMRPKVLVLSKRYDEQSLKHAMELRSKNGTHLILDLCDNHFYNNSNDLKWIERANSLRFAVSIVDTVVTSSNALAEVVRAEMKDYKFIQVIEDAVEMPFSPSLISMPFHPFAEYQISRFRKYKTKLSVDPGRSLVWFGNHGSSYADGGMGDLRLIKDKLHKINNVNRIIIIYTFKY